MIDNKLNNNASKFRLRMKNKSVRIHIPQVQNNGKVVPRTFQPTGFLLRHTFNCSHHRRRMSCHFAPISQERNFTSVLFFLSCHKNYNVEIDLSCSCVSFLWCETKHLTCNSGSCVCSPTRQYVSAGCWLLRSKVVQRKRWFWPLCAFKYALTSFWQLYTNIWATSPQPLNDELYPSLKSNEMDKFRAKFGPWLWTHRLKLIIAAGLKRSRLWKIIRLVGWVRVNNCLVLDMRLHITQYKKRHYKHRNGCWNTTLTNNDF